MTGFLVLATSRFERELKKQLPNTLIWPSITAAL